MIIRERDGEVTQTSLRAWKRWKPVRWAAAVSLALVFVAAVAAPASAHVRFFFGLGVPVPVYSYPYAYPYPYADPYAAGYAYPPPPVFPSYYSAYAPYPLGVTGFRGRLSGHWAGRRGPWGRGFRGRGPARWR